MHSNTAEAIIASVLIMTIGGCFGHSYHEMQLTQREEEKTKQLQIQARMDSIKAMTINKQL